MCINCKYREPYQIINVGKPNERQEFSCNSPDDDFDGLCSPENCNESIFVQISVFGLSCMVGWWKYCYNSYMEAKNYERESKKNNIAK